MDSELIIALVVAAPVVLFVLWYQTWAYLQTSKWRKVAETLGLAFDSGGIFGLPSMRGQLHGVEVAVEAEYKSNRVSNSSQMRVRTSIIADPGDYVPRGLILSREGLFGSLGKLVGREDIEVGHAKFDDHFVIKGRNQAHVKALLGDAELRTVLLEQLERCNNLRVRETEVCIDEQSRFLLGRGLERRIEAVALVANALSRVAFSLSEQFPPREHESEDERTDDIYRQLGEEHRNSA